VNILLNLVLIPRFSYLGASAATVITEGLLSLVSFVPIRSLFWDENDVRSGLTRVTKVAKKFDGR
jgi:hypothetical protein